MDIQRHLSSEPVVARPPSAAYRLQKAWQRNKLAFGGVVVVAVGLLAGLGVAAVGWRQSAVSGRIAQMRAAEARRSLYVADMGLAQQAWEAEQPRAVEATAARDRVVSGACVRVGPLATTNPSRPPDPPGPPGLD